MTKNSVRSAAIKDHTGVAPRNDKVRNSYLSERINKVVLKDDRRIADLELALFY
jgi:hypothetical protein